MEPPVSEPVIESGSRPLTPEVIAQDEAPVINSPPPPPMTDKERKQFAKQEKERLKQEKEEEKRRKKEEEKERKRLEKERKSLIAEEKKAAAKAKSKGNRKRSPEREREVRERRDSRSSNDIGREWHEAKSGEDRSKPATPDRTRKRMSSFEDVKKASDSDQEEEDEERPPTPPAPLPIDHTRKAPRRGSRDDDGSHVSADYADEEEGEEVSF